MIFVKVLETLACGNCIIEESVRHLRAEPSVFAVWYLIIGLLDWSSDKCQQIALPDMLPGLLKSVQLTGCFADAGQTIREGFWQLQNMATEWIDNGQSPGSPPANVRRGGFCWALPSSITLEGVLHAGWHQASRTLEPYSAMLCGMPTNPALLWKRTL